MDIGLAISAVEYAIQVAHLVRSTARSLNQNTTAYNALLSRFRSIRKTLHYVRVTGNIDLKSPIWGSAFRRIHSHFQDATSELNEINEELKANPLIRIFTTQNTTERLRTLEDDIDQLQRDLDMLGFFTLSYNASEVHSKHALHDLQNIQNSLAVMEQRLNTMSNNSIDTAAHSKKQSKRKSSHHTNDDKSREIKLDETEPVSICSDSSQLFSSSPKGIFGTSENETDDGYEQRTLVQQVQDLESSLEKSFSKILQSNMSDDDKDIVCDRILAMWKHWKINPGDVMITCEDRISREIEITDSSLSQIVCDGKLSIRDHEGNIIRVANVSVKLLCDDIKHEDALDTLVKKVLLLRELNHPCTIYYYGGYWDMDLYHSTRGTDRNNLQEEKAISTKNSSFLVYERMTYSLCDVLDEDLLTDRQHRIGIIRDVARAGKHVHSKGVVNFDLQPNHVFLRIVDGDIVGTAKIGNLELACETIIERQANGEYDQLSSSTSEEQILQEDQAVDVWHFGVMSCLLLSSSRVVDEDLNLRSICISQHNDKIHELLPSLIEGIEEKQLQELISDCISSEYSSRPSFRNIYNQLKTYLKVGSVDPSKLKDGRALRTEAKDCFYGRNGTSIDLEQAAILFRKAAICGETSSLVNLGDCHYYGLGVEKDVKKAIELYHEAADQDNTAGLVRLGDCYQRGTGVLKDINFSVNLYRRAASYGNASAQYKLGCYLLNEDDSGLSSPEEAASLFQKAAAMGHRFAEFYLGICFEEGHGVGKDMESALSWYEKSAAHGHIGAQWALERLRRLLRFIKNSQAAKDTVVSLE